MHELSDLGFGPFFVEQLQSWKKPGTIPARIVAEHRQAYEVWSGAGVGDAQLAGRLRLELEAQGLPAVGDWVTIDQSPSPDRNSIIDRVFSRRTAFVRGAAGRQARAQVVAANVDLVFAVCGLDTDYNLRRIERYLARIWASGAAPAVILNKVDICTNVSDRVREVVRHFPAVTVHATSALRADSLASIRDSIGAGVTAAFVGSSGAGKSTIVNALVGEKLMNTGEVRERDGRGRHVTSRRQLVRLPEGGLVLDTPGMRELQIVDEQGLGAVFDDIASVSARCRFKDCRHQSEPGCAVTAAVASGEIEAERLAHYQKLEQEALAYEQRHDERLRRHSGRNWGQLHDEAARLRRWKGRT